MMVYLSHLEIEREASIPLLGFVQEDSGREMDSHSSNHTQTMEGNFLGAGQEDKPAIPPVEKKGRNYIKLGKTQDFQRNIRTKILCTIDDWMNVV